MERRRWVIIFVFAGLIRSLVVHSGHTWLATGTSHASIVTWDLRYHLPISVLQAPRLHPNNGSAAATITRLRIYEANSRNQQHFNSIASNFASVGTTNTTTMVSCCRGVFLGVMPPNSPSFWAILFVFANFGTPSGISIGLCGLGCSNYLWIYMPHYCHFHTYIIMP